MSPAGAQHDANASERVRTLPLIRFVLPPSNPSQIIASVPVSLKLRGWLSKD